MTASFTLANIEEIIVNFSSSHQILKFFKLITKIFLFIFVILSISRIIALYKGYHSSLKMYNEFFYQESHLKLSDSKENIAIVCLGKEWHRFPSNFFVPKGFEVQFVASEFRGQLPKHFESNVDFPTRIIPKRMNDLNQEEPSRYLNATLDCHYLIDSDYDNHQERDYPYSKDSTNWTKLKTLKFLDSQQTSIFYRSFYIPYLYESNCKFIDYNLLKNNGL